CSRRPPAPISRAPTESDASASRACAGRDDGARLAGERGHFGPCSWSARRLFTMAIWLGVIPGPERARVLAQAGPHETILKARLRSPPAHPRALTALCEALALWSGEPVRAVLAAGEPGASFDTTRWLGPEGPTSNALF